MLVHVVPDHGLLLLHPDESDQVVVGGFFDPIHEVRQFRGGRQTLSEAPDDALQLLLFDLAGCRRLGL